MRSRLVGDGIAIEPLDGNERSALSIVVADGGHTRIRISDVATQRVTEVIVRAPDVLRIIDFLSGCA